MWFISLLLTVQATFIAYVSRKEFPIVNRNIISCDLYGNGDGLAITLTKIEEGEAASLDPSAAAEEDEIGAFGDLEIGPAAHQTAWAVVSVSCAGQTFRAVDPVIIPVLDGSCLDVLNAANDSRMIRKMIKDRCKKPNFSTIAKAGEVSQPADLVSSVIFSGVEFNKENETVRPARSRLLVNGNNIKCRIQSRRRNVLEIVAGPGKFLSNAFCGKQGQRDLARSRFGSLKTPTSPSSVAAFDEQVTLPETPRNNPMSGTLSTFSIELSTLLPNPFRRRLLQTPIARAEAQVWCANLNVLNPDSVCQHAQFHGFRIESWSFMGSCSMYKLSDDGILSLSVRRIPGTVNDWAVWELRCGEEAEPLPISERSAETQFQLRKIAARFGDNFDRLEGSSWDGCAALLPEHFSGVSFEKLCAFSP